MTNENATSKKPSETSVKPMKTESTENCHDAQTKKDSGSSSAIRTKEADDKSHSGHQTDQKSKGKEN